MFEVLSAHLDAILAVMLTLVAAAVVSARSDAVALWFQSVWHSLPLIGGISWLARRHRSGQMSGMNTESSAVLALCGSYARFIRVLNRHDYDNYMNYLRKAGDLGRRPFPPYLWVVIFSMILVEAAGLAYVLAGWTLPGASEFAQRIAAAGIGFLIAVILVFFTHWAGVEIDHANRYRRDRREWIAAGRTGPLYGPDLSLNDAQNVDDDEPAFRQRATRGHGKTTYMLTTVTVLMVLAVGSGAAFVRGQVLEQELVLESSTRARTVERFDLGLPETNSSERIAADEQAIRDEMVIKRRGGWGTLVILAIIFFFLQLLGIFFGYRYSFNGRLSKDAYRALMADRFSSYNELLQFYDRIADIAQSKVERLQQIIEQRDSDGMGGGLRRHYSFRDYLQAREMQRRDQPLGGDPDGASGTGAAAVPRSTPTPAPAARGEAEVPAVDANASANGVPKAAIPAGPVGRSAPAPIDEYLARRGRNDTVAPPLTPQQMLEQAEALERERASERAAGRGRGASKAKSGTQIESEAG